jgi:hypothetical protein
MSDDWTPVQSCGNQIKGIPLYLNFTTLSKSLLASFILPFFFMQSLNLEITTHTTLCPLACRSNPLLTPNTPFNFHCIYVFTNTSASQEADVCFSVPDSHVFSGNFLTTCSMGMMSQFLVSSNLKQKRYHRNIYLYRFMAGIIWTCFNKKILLDNQPHEFSAQFQHFRGLVCLHY